MGPCEQYLTVQNEMGETPIWVPEENALYWVDAAKHIVYRVDTNTREYESFTPDLPVRGLCRRQSGGWLIITNTGLAFWDPESDACQFIIDPYADIPHMQFNDGMVDRRGRLIVGSYNSGRLDAPDGSLYRLDTDHSLHKIDKGLVLSNGIGLSPDNKTLYVVEMYGNMVTAYDYDINVGAIGNRRVFVQIPEDEGMPDGLTVDSEGFIWTAQWGGGRVNRYDPKGQLERAIEVPSKIVTCIGFGGEKLDELYVTTAWYGLTDTQRKEQPQAGDLFRIKTDVKGIVEPFFLG